MPITDFLSIEFGVTYIVQGQEVSYLIPVDDTVRESLYEMHQTFIKTYDELTEQPAEVFTPSEKYASSEKLYIDLNHENLDTLRSLYNAQHQINPVQLSEIGDKIIYYFAIFRHTNGAKHVAVKRPAQFKGLLRKKLIHFIDDTLKVVQDDVFKLDIDFDFIIHDPIIDILHPSGFIFISNIDEEILRNAVNATRQLATRITFIDFESISNYVGHSKVSAKLIASIKSRTDLEQTSRDKLIAKCTLLGLTIRQEGDGLVPDDASIIDFLQILDRREYDVDLTIDGEIEIYEAPSRKKVIRGN